MKNCFEKGQCVIKVSKRGAQLTRRGQNIGNGSIQLFG
jgi:hypothetical protein